MAARLEAGLGTLVLAGPNGSGKTSLLLAMLGVLPPTRGSLRLGGEVLYDSAAGVEVAPEHRGLAWVPQAYALFPHLSVRENLAFALDSRFPLPPEVRAERLNRALADLALEPLAERRPALLSGGEQQRVALARALVTRPRALLFDEPLAALDVHARREVRAFLVATLARLALPTIVITHDAADAKALGGRVAVLEAGAIVQTGTWADLVAKPATPFVAEFVASG